MSEALSGPTDKVGPWTIKSISLDARDLAIGQARAAKMTTGQWVERAIRIAVEVNPGDRHGAEPGADNSDRLLRLAIAAEKLAAIPFKATRTAARAVAERIMCEAWPLDEPPGAVIPDSRPVPTRAIAAPETESVRITCTNLRSRNRDESGTAPDGRASAVESGHIAAHSD
jgi:hypothetical protein